MQLEDLYKLAGIQQSNTPAIEPKPVEQPVAEQPMDGRDDMKAMIALVSPEQLNQLVGDTPVEEEGFANSGDEYAGEPEAYNGTLGSPADLSLRRYLGANGQPVKMENVYADHKVEDITEAWQAYKVKEGELPPGLKAYQEKKKKKDDVDEHHQKDAEGNTIPHDDEVAEQKVAEEPNEANKFIKAKIDAEEDGDDSFTVDGKKYKVKDSADLDRLRALAGMDEINEDPGMSWKDGIPDELMMVIKKYDITPDDAEQMATRDMNADIDAIANLHDQYLDRIAKEGKITPDENGQFMFSDEEDELHDIDMGEEWMNSPEYGKVTTMVSELCSAMGMEADREECGNGLMQYVDEGATAESLNDLRKLAGI